MKHLGNIRTRLTRRVAILLIALLGAVATPVTQMVTAIPASASATICTGYGITIHLGVRNGAFCADVNGSGTNINYVGGNFGTTIPGIDRVCNPSIKLDVFDRWDHWVASRQGSQRSGCSWGSYNFVNNIPVYWNFPQANGGKLYVTLQSSGTKVATVSFNFHS